MGNVEMWLVFENEVNEFFNAVNFVTQKKGRKFCTPKGGANLILDRLGDMQRI